MSSEYRQKVNQSEDCVEYAAEAAEYTPHANRVDRIRGRATHQSPKPRYHSIDRESYTTDQPMKFDTIVKEESCRNIITRIRSPDLPIEQSVNPYRGCEHGCIYCYARPSHAWLDLSPGIDFETRLFARSGADESLRRQLMKKSYHCSPIALGSNTDPYQPIERRWQITRSILKVLLEFRHPCTIVTKSWLIEHDIDILQALAKQNLVRVFFSVTTLDHELARILEPRATAPSRRVQSINTLHEAGIDVGVMFAPVIPAINDCEMEAVLKSCRKAGAAYADYVLLRLPLEVEPLFSDWLETWKPDRKEHVLSLLRQCHKGEVYNAGFHQRMRGSGVYAQMIRQRFRHAHRRLGFIQKPAPLATDLFRIPMTKGKQLSLLSE